VLALIDEAPAGEGEDILEMAADGEEWRGVKGSGTARGTKPRARRMS